MLGSPSQKEYAELATKVPFEPKLFNEFPVINKGNDDSEKYKHLYANFKDKANLCSLLNRIFTYIPEQRITAKEALAHPFFHEVLKFYSQMNLH